MRKIMYDAKRKGTIDRCDREAESIEAYMRCGCIHSTDEGAVMALEGRDTIIQ